MGFYIGTRTKVSSSIGFSSLETHASQRKATETQGIVISYFLKPDIIHFMVSLYGYFSFYIVDLCAHIALSRAVAD